jgi:hypothetical protein
MKYSIACNREDIIKIKREERSKFIIGLLEAMGVVIDLDCFPEDLQLESTVEQRINLKKILNKYSVILIDHGEDGLEMYFEREKVGTWNKPFFELRKDDSEIDRSKRMYTIINFEYSTIFDKEEET